MFAVLAFIKALIGAVWRACKRMLSFAVRALGWLVLVVIVLAVVLGLFFNESKPSALGDKTMLVLRPRGALVEHKHFDADVLTRSLLKKSNGGDIALPDMLKVLDAAAKDDKISGVLLMPDDLKTTALPPMLREVALALDRFKQSGKKVVAWATRYDQAGYYLATHADEVYLDPLGSVDLHGFGGLRTYYRDAFERLGVNVHVLKLGKYKSFGEVYSQNAPSPEALEADRSLYFSLWGNYTHDVESARRLPLGTVDDTIARLPQLLAQEKGDVAKLLQKLKFVDDLLPFDRLRERLVARGAEDAQTGSFRQIGFDAYLHRLPPSKSGDAVGVIVAEGAIVDEAVGGEQVEGEATAKLIRQARRDQHIKAIVLRVNSPGGSVTASERIRRELELARAEGKPVVVSMGNLAASGGYWISQAADTVMADASTITGSIGVIALLPRVDAAIDKLSLHTWGVSTTWLAQAQDPRSPMNEQYRSMVQGVIAHLYDEFLAVVAKARNLTPDKVDAVAQGRVWSGEQAKERGLIDAIGGYRDALQTAAKLGKLAEDFNVRSIEPERNRWEELLDFFGDSLASAFLSHTLERLGTLVGIPLNSIAQKPMTAWSLSGRQNLDALSSSISVSPYGSVAHCLCGVGF